MDVPIISAGATTANARKASKAMTPSKNIRVPRDSAHLGFWPAPREEGDGFGRTRRRSSLMRSGTPGSSGSRPASGFEPPPEPDTIMRVRDKGEFDVRLRRFPEGEVYDAD